MKNSNGTMTIEIDGTTYNFQVELVGRDVHEEHDDLFMETDHEDILGVQISIGT